MTIQQRHPLPDDFHVIDRHLILERAVEKTTESDHFKIDPYDSMDILYEIAKCLYPNRLEALLALETAFMTVASGPVDKPLPGPALSALNITDSF